ncbi:MAG: hypothetical protein SVZ03_14305 [Spirochaetota bacterium]|nr:hypothetical protein [Spirochaetota bacterium]
MLNVIKTLSLTLIILIFNNTDNTYAQKSAEIKTKKTRISWEEVEGAKRYRVHITNVYGKLILKRDVSSNFVDFIISPGNYRIRIGAINKFNKVGSWSDWADIKIQRATKYKIKEKKRDKVPSEFGLKLGIGVPYFQLLSEWDSLYHNSFSGVYVNIGYCLGNFLHFNLFHAFRFIGLEIESTYTRFKSKDAFNREHVEMSNIIAGCNLFFTTRFSIPFNFILRGGGGVAFTKQDRDMSDFNEEEDVTTSQDPYYRVGLSIEYRFAKHLYLETGIDYYAIKFLEEQLKSMRYFCLIGVRI